ncbi:MAG: hypothetical protein IH946_02370 [Bacteroidetes bacterium]|nr:hypothetical protein [Bacteroidota bacterium]
MNYLKIFLVGILVLILTIVTQTGGMILLITFPLFFYINRIVPPGFLRFILKPISFSMVYLFFTFLIIPSLAESFGRTPLPISSSGIQPLNMLTVILNRHYVKPDLHKALTKVSGDMNKEDPDLVVAYLDAGFPFIDGFPLLPHLTHDDGRKVDLALFYLNPKTGEYMKGDAPTFLGYGSSIPPSSDEIDMPRECERRGYWQYSILAQYFGTPNALLDNHKTYELITRLSAESETNKIFIEPHLRERLQLKGEKIRYHGCHAVRHDDHIHVEIL